LSMLIALGVKMRDQFLERRAIFTTVVGGEEKANV